MTVDTFASVSDSLMTAAVIGYVAATGVHGAYNVFATRSDRVPALVGGGGDGPGPEPAGPSRVAQRFGTAAVAVTVAAAAAHTGAVVARGLAAGRIPLGNMYEFILATTLAGALAWLVLLVRRPAVRALGLFATLAVALLLGGAGRVHVRVAPLVPALESPWLRIHVTAAATAAGILLLGFVAAALYVLRLRHDGAVATGRPRGPAIGALPSAEALDRLAVRLHVVAFPIWTFAIICGAVWAEAAWGRYWGWDPKETWAFVSWVLYAAYLHARTTAGWRGRPAALIAVAAWITMMVNLFAVNLLVPGLHSYAGV